MDQSSYLSIEQASDATGLSEDELARDALDPDSPGPAGFQGPDGRLWFNRTVIHAWVTQCS